MKPTLLITVPVLALLAGSATAQIAFEESMTNWPHSPVAGWTDDFTLAGSKGGKVDRLDSTATFTYTRTLNALKKGHYVATVRFMKFTDNVGVAPISLEVFSGGVRKTAETITHSQAIDRWIYGQTVTFTVPSDNAPVLFRLFNLDTTITKQNYYFDWFKVGQLPEKAIEYQSLDYDYAPWSGAWLGNATWFKNHVAEATSAFGEVAEPAGVNWMEHKSFYGWSASDPKHDLVLQPGVYTFNYRIFVPASGLWDLDLLHNINAAGFNTRTWTTAEQKTGAWQLSPNVSFKVTQANTGLRFIFRNIQTGSKFGYQLDSFMLRRGAFDVSGTSCKSSAGDVHLSGNVPQLGENFTIEVTGVPSVCVSFIGAQSVSIDLTNAGAGGCTLYTLPLTTFGLAATGGVATRTFPVPNSTSLLGAQWYEQVAVLDASANALGIATSELGTAILDN
ncbi:MAG: hypothetical protein KDC95_08975 [Planctomycetes bacterium]|nr:hypothetical protein [Planctomycetota bacterium]